MHSAGFSDPSTNLLDRLDATIADHQGGTALLPVVPYRPRDASADVEVKVCDAAWRASVAGTRALASLGQVSDPASFATTGDRLLARFADVRLTALGHALEQGGADPLATRHTATERRWTVNFGDPNTTKALHVGHLRNVALGNSLASAAEALGTQVVRQSRVGDFGRNMGEAMAGYLRHGRGRTPEQQGVKGDHLIGACYVRYVSELAEQPQSDPVRPDPQDGDVVLSREREVHRDAAEELLARWRRGDPATRRLFDDVRRWVTDGHDATYARLGVRVDRTLFESDDIAHCDALAERALAEGVIERVASGATMYPTGEPSYPQMLLHRRDGFPTQHLRYVATCDATRPLLAGTRSIAVFGTEWRSLSRYTEAILRALYPGEELHPTDNLVHGMVVTDEGVVKSSKGGALLVDELFERLCSSGAITALQRRHQRCEAEQLTRIVLLGFFLGRPLKQRVPIALDELLDVRHSVGWSLAQAWARAWDPRHDGPADADLDDSEYRFLLVQSQRHRRLLVKCVEDLDLLPFVRFHYHLSRWYSGTQPSPRLARAMRSVLGGGLEALGLAAVVGSEAPCPS
jgi:arginyl-tRNA synthetase